MPTLLIRLAGPMQSWGTQSQFGLRETRDFPSKSGVIGLLSAAQGRHREADVADLAELQMLSRVEAPGLLSQDFHTAGSGKYLGRPYWVAKVGPGKGHAVLSNRQFLADAEFLVGLEGEPNVLEHCLGALSNPKYPLFLGRRAYPPTFPLILGLYDTTPERAFAQIPWRCRPGLSPPDRLAWVGDAEFMGQRLDDTPHSRVSYDLPVRQRLNPRFFSPRNLAITMRPRPGTPITSMEEWLRCISRVLS
jgi:CRISPR system Cascade subunit CasD